MSAHNPEDKQQKSIGISEKIFAVNYFPTVAAFENIILGTRLHPLKSPTIEGDYYYDLGSANAWYTFNEVDGKLVPTVIFQQEGDHSQIKSPRTSKHVDFFRFLARKYWINLSEEDLVDHQGEIINSTNYPIGLSFYHPSSVQGLHYQPWEPHWNPSANPHIFENSPSKTIKKIMDQNRSDYKTDYFVTKNWVPFSVWIEDEATIIKPSSWMLNNGWSKGPGYKQQMIIYHDTMDSQGNKRLASNYDISSDTFEWFIHGFSGDSGNETFPIASCNFDHAGGPYFDHVHEYNYPSSLDKIKETGVNVKALYADIKTRYNFYLKEYEKAMGQIGGDLETFLPSLGILSTSKYVSSLSKEYRTLISLLDTNKSGGCPKELKYATGQTKVDLSRYYRAWSLAMQKNASHVESRILSGQEDYLWKVANQSRHIVVPPDQMKTLANAQKDKFKYPMYSEVEFSTDGNSAVGDLLLDTNLWASLLSYIIAAVNGNPFTGTSIGNTKFEGMPMQEIQESSNDGSPKKSLTNKDFSQFNSKFVDLNSWIVNVVDKNLAIDNPALYYSQYMFLDPSRSLREDMSKEHAPFKMNSIEKLLELTGFKAKLNNILSPHYRNYKEILEGKKCYNEAVFYRVEKRNAETGQVIQNFYFLNTSDFDVINYVDTQVFYNKKYEYKVYVWNLVVGTEYVYQSPTVASELNKNEQKKKQWRFKAGGFSDFAASLDPESQFAALVDVTSWNSPVLIEMPYYSPPSFKVIDDPPVPPWVDIVPYRATTDKVLIMLNNDTGEYHLDPVIISQSDNDAIQKLREDKGYKPTEKILYKTDDQRGRFQAFRTTIMPSSYEDFDGTKIMELENKSAFIDDIKSNTKYYYTFRIIDNHGHVSNPSPVYEFELVRNAKSVYPELKVYDKEDLKKIATSEGKLYRKPLSKYIYLKPSESQIEINYEGMEDLAEKSESASEFMPFLGYENERLIGKKFKIRLTSKLTGRRADLNLTFKSKFDPAIKIKK